MTDDERTMLEVKAEELLHELRTIGLYESLHNAVIIVDPRPYPGGPTRPVVRLELNIGELAFSDRVQDPQRDVVNRSITPMENSYLEQEVEDIIRRLRGEDE